MALTVNTNLTSMSSVNSLNRTQSALSNTFGRISSGLRINRAADDAAGFAVAENLDATSRSLDVAARNANDGISMIQTAEGATQEVGEIVKRMRELSVQSASDTLDNAERAYIQTEVDELVAELDRIATTTNFNGVSLMDGSVPSVDVQVGVGNTAADSITLTLGDLRAATLGVNGLDVSTSGAASTAIGTLDTALDTINSQRATFGAVQNRLSSTLANINTYSENISASKSRIMDADFAKEAASLSKYQTMQQAGIAILGQANAMNQGALRLVG